jgi:hypothetical protein
MTSEKDVNKILNAVFQSLGAVHSMLANAESLVEFAARYDSGKLPRISKIIEPTCKRVSDVTDTVRHCLHPKPLAEAKAEVEQMHAELKELGDALTPMLDAIDPTKTVSQKGVSDLAGKTHYWWEDPESQEMKDRAADPYTFKIDSTFQNVPTEIVGQETIDVNTKWIEPASTGRGVLTPTGREWSKPDIQEIPQKIIMKGNRLGFMSKMRPEIEELLKKSVDAVNNLPPLERAILQMEQKLSMMNGLVSHENVLTREQRIEHIEKTVPEYTVLRAYKELKADNADLHARCLHLETALRNALDNFIK